MNIWLLSQADFVVCIVWSKFCALAFGSFLKTKKKKKKLSILLSIVRVREFSINVFDFEDLVAQYQ